MPGGPSSCLEPALARLARPDCLQRISVPLPAGAGAALPVYLLHTPLLPTRAEKMMERLRAVGAPDLTLIACADRADVDTLSVADRACLYPGYVVTHWSARPTCAEPHCAAGLSNGTLSLALKHQLAYRDVVARSLRSALVLEDDSILPPDLWRRLAAYALPAGTHVFFAGSYSPNPRGGTLRDEPVLPGSEPAVHARGAARRNGTRPAIVGSNGYVVTAAGARGLLQPVRAETDVQLSLLGPSPLCSRTPPQCYPAVSIEVHCGEPVRDCPISPPPNQYGPTRWLIWQDPSAPDRSSHALLHGPRMRPGSGAEGKRGGGTRGAGAGAGARRRGRPPRRPTPHASPLKTYSSSMERLVRSYSALSRRAASLSLSSFSSSSLRFFSQRRYTCSGSFSSGMLEASSHIFLSFHSQSSPTGSQTTRYCILPWPLPASGQDLWSSTSWTSNVPLPLSFFGVPPHLGAGFSSMYLTRVRP